MKNKQTNGMFCQLFGDTARNRVLEFFLEGYPLKYSIKDIVGEGIVSQAAVYITLTNLCYKDKFLIKVLIKDDICYKLDTENPRVNMLLKTFKLCLKLVAEEVK